MTTAKDRAAKEAAPTQDAATPTQECFDEFEDTPGGIFLDAHGNPHDAWGNALDAASLAAAGVTPQDPATPDPTSHYTLSELSLISGGPAPVPQAPAAEGASAQAVVPVTGSFSAGRPGKPTQASVDAAAALAAPVDPPVEPPPPAGDTSSRRRQHGPSA